MNVNVMSGATAALLTTWDSNHGEKTFTLANGRNIKRSRITRPSWELPTFKFLVKGGNLMVSFKCLELGIPLLAT